MNFFTKHFLKCVSALLLGGAGFLTAQAEIITGTCGGIDTHFKLDTDAKTLTISGTSDTGTNDDVRDSAGNNFSFGSYSIDTIYVEGGIRSLGKRLFKGVEPKHVYLPCTIFGTNDYLFELADATEKIYTGYVLHIPADCWLAADSEGKKRPTSKAYNGYGLPASSVKTDWDVHQYDWKQTVEATCLTAGSEVMYCANAKCPANKNNVVYDTRVVPSHVEALTHVDAVAPSCLHPGPGTSDYYLCEGCSKIYTDASAKNETDMEALKGDFAYSATGIIQTTAAVDATIGKHVVYHTDAPSSNEFIIYTPEQVGYTGTISEIAFRVVTASPARNKTSTVKIEMATTDMTSFEDGKKDYTFDFTTVFSAKMAIGQTVGWETIKLSKSFVYDGTKNLVVRVSHEGGRSETYYKDAVYGYQVVEGYSPLHSVAVKYPTSMLAAYNSAADRAPQTACPHLPDTKFTFSTVSSHHFVHHEAIAANCTESGRINFEKCDICHNCFRSEQADRKTDNGMIAAADTLVAALGHIYVNYDDAAAVCDEDGLYHTECTRCQDGHDSQRYAKVVITKVGYTTIYYGVPLHSEGDDAVSLAVTDITDDGISLTPVENLNADEGYVVQGTPNEIYWFPEQKAAGDMKSQLKGTTDGMACEASKYYVLGVGKSSAKVGFYPFTGTSLGAHKAFLTKEQLESKTGVALVNGYRFILPGEDDAETAIEQLAADEADMTLYDLSGRKVTAPVKGQPYIQAGKKVVF